MDKLKLGAFSVIVLLLLSFVVGLASAQYTNSKTSNFTIGSDGTVTVDQKTDMGLTYLIRGTSGSSGSITASLYNGNPQATASIPDDVSLNHFLIITFDVNPSDFTEAQITISYSDSDVANLQQPYSIYKYNPSTDNYVQISADVDTDAKTMTVILTSVDDPLLAIGGLKTETRRGYRQLLG